VTPHLPVTLSHKAAEEVVKIMQTKNIPAGYGLRIGIRGGSGCGGAQLILGFDKKKDSDVSYLFREIDIFIDKRHMLYVVGKEVDFHEGAEARGFVFVDSPSGKTG
jgi:iron-sulfur cluster assembly protein